MKLRIKGKNIKGLYIEVKLVDAPNGYFFADVMTFDNKTWERLTDAKGGNMMFRNRIHVLHTFASNGWHFQDYASRYKGLPTYLLIHQL